MRGQVLTVYIDQAADGAAAAEAFQHLGALAVEKVQMNYRIFLRHVLSSGFISFILAARRACLTQRVFAVTG